MRLRRVAVAALVFATMAAVTALMARLLATGGPSWAEWGMLVAFALTTPWIALGFWNAVIGFAILRLARDPVATVNPLAAGSEGDAIATRTAIVMAVRNEDTARVFRHLRTIQASVDATGWGRAFHYFVISDTTDPVIAAEEERQVTAWAAEDWAGPRITYRRRTDNFGFKAGNVRDFVERHADGFDHMVMLDADSLMSGRAILRMTRIMQANPQLGLLQLLIAGLPAGSLFARVFQFGMRQGMRSFTFGSAWWQGDHGPYWGHNAIIRIAPFKAHCRLPMIPGEGPLRGHILSHDQVEAVMMRRAGFEVRVLPEEDGSWEENPPSLPDFAKRDLRWCHGNMQYVHLIGLPGLPFLARVQLLLAILMYVGSPAWMAFIGFGLAHALLPAVPGAPPFPAELGLALFGLMMFMTFAPKILGIVDLLVRRSERARYGGAARILGGAGIETLFSVLLAPVVSFGHAVFMAKLCLFGQSKVWAPQDRDSHYVPLAAAFRGFWAPTLAGIAVAAILWTAAPGALPWAAPLIVGFTLAIPFTSLSSSPRLGAWARARGLCAIPEEVVAVDEIDAAQDRAPRPALLAEAA